MGGASRGQEGQLPPSKTHHNNFALKLVFHVLPCATPLPPDEIV